LYLRISEDKDGREEGVKAQEKWGRAYAAEHWPGLPVEVYSDNDLSAAKDDVVRPEFERLRAAIRAGEAAHIWAVEQSRLERKEAGWFALAADLTAAGIGEIHTKRDGIVKVGDLIAGLMAVINAHEVRRNRERLMDKLDEIASQGRPAGSRPFGYKHAANEQGVKTYVVVPEQAEAVRWAAEKVLAGWSLGSVAAALRARGLTGAHGGKLTPGSVRQMVTCASVAGHRIHRGADLGKGNWPPILDEATWQACQAALAVDRDVVKADGTRYQVGKPHRGYRAQRYVLTGGLARCFKCGAPLVGTIKQVGPGKTKPYLLCHPVRGGKGCVAIMGLETEQYVVERLFHELDRPEFLDAIAADDHADRREQIVNELAGVEAKRAELAGLWASGMSTEEWQAARGGLAEMERQLRAELAAKPPPPARVTIEQARESWPLMTLDERRAFLRLFIAEVKISKAVPGRKGFDPSRCSITWRIQE
jgi:DNA invertase Pin-like site-specific DNA recombinase